MAELPKLSASVRNHVEPFNMPMNVTRNNVCNRILDGCILLFYCVLTRITETCPRASHQLTTFPHDLVPTSVPSEAAAYPD